MIMQLSLASPTMEQVEFSVSAAIPFGIRLSAGA
jgi:hypothetical protein